jgi:hypothetical protein
LRFFFVDAALPLAAFTPYHTVKHFLEGGQRAAALKRSEFA